MLATSCANSSNSRLRSSDCSACFRSVMSRCVPHTRINRPFSMVPTRLFRKYFGRPNYFLNNLVGTIENGRFIRVWGTQRDITDRKQAEQSLERSRELLELAQEVASIGTFEWQIQSGRVEWTRELEALYGLEPGSAGKTFERWASTLHPEDRQRALAD